MTPLDKIRAKAKFDENTGVGWNWRGVVNRLRTGNYAYKTGARDQHAKDMLIITALCDALELYEKCLLHECYCDGETTCGVCRIVESINASGEALSQVGILLEKAGE